MTGVTWGLSVLAVLALVTVWLHNRLARARVRVDEASAQVDTELQRRHDLVPPLVATVAGYADHERAALTAVVTARSRALTTSTFTERAAAERDLGDALAGLLAVTEAYPELRADTRFRALASELTNTEHRLAFARDFASHRVATYHRLVDTFPSLLVARAFAFEHATSFAVGDAAARRVPDVELGGAHP